MYVYLRRVSRVFQRFGFNIVRDVVPVIFRIRVADGRWCEKNAIISVKASR